MTGNVEQVLIGFFSLSEEEQGEFIDALNHINKQPPTEKGASKRKLFETHGRVLMGAVSSACLCCGR